VKAISVDDGWEDMVRRYRDYLLKNVESGCSKDMRSKKRLRKIRAPVPASVWLICCTDYEYRTPEDASISMGLGADLQAQFLTWYE
jgi:hypothetical protein